MATDLDGSEAHAGAGSTTLADRVVALEQENRRLGEQVRSLMAAENKLFVLQDHLNAQQRVKCAFDAKGLLNPGKVFPQLHRCAELGRMHISGGKLPFPDIPRF